MRIFSFIEEYIDKTLSMETFFEFTGRNPRKINESSDELNACLKKVHKLGLEIQSIQKDVVSLYDRKASMKPFSKEWKKTENMIGSMLKTKNEIVKELDFETRKLERLVSILDPKGEIQDFFK